MISIFTVGHSNHPLERFLELLSLQQVQQLVDVRSRPYSRHAPHYSKPQLQQSVTRHGLQYLFLGRCLGGLLQREAGETDVTQAYQRRALELDFGLGLDRVLELASDGRTALMCAEEDPRRCHRHLLLAPQLSARGAQVVHLRGDGRLQADGELARRQLGLF